MDCTGCKRKPDALAWGFEPEAKRPCRSLDVEAPPASTALVPAARPEAAPALPPGFTWPFDAAALLHPCAAAPAACPACAATAAANAQLRQQLGWAVQQLAAVTRAYFALQQRSRK